MRHSTTLRLAAVICWITILTACGTTPAPDGGAAFPSPANRPTAASEASAGAEPAAGSPPPQVGCPDAAGPISGPIVFGMDANLYAIGADGGQPQALTNVGGGLFAYEPAWSPDGRTLAFTLSQPAADPALSWLPIGMICGIDRDTGKGRLLARGDDPLHGLNEASWAPDGASLLVTRHQAQLNEQGQYMADRMSLARYTLADGSLQPLLDNAMSGVLSPDGQRMAYLAIEPQNLTVSLMIGGVDGSGAEPVPAVEPPLFTMFAPRWSPDGSQLVFTASGGDAAPSQPSGLNWLERLLGVQVARAHGPPTDLWLAGVEGPPRRLTTLALDDTRAAWSPDGTRLAVTNGLGGVSLLDVATGEQRPLTDEGNYGGISWAPR